MSERVQGEVTAAAAATGSKDPEVALAAVAALRGLVEVLEALNVENARAKGWSWEAIAARLGVTKLTGPAWSTSGSRTCGTPQGSSASRSLSGSAWTWQPGLRLLPAVRS